jgi:hypothetical protein
MFSVSTSSTGKLAVQSRVASAKWLALVVAIFALLTLPLLVQPSGGYDFDEQTYHLPAIRQIATHWPSLSIAEDSLSATAPGYHWILAGLSLLVGSDLLTLRLLNFAVSLAGLTVLFFWLAQRRGGAEAALLLLPLACSNFYVKSAAWIVTDNPALAFSTAVLLLVLSPSRSTGTAAAGGVFAVLATMTRQMHAWLALPMALRAWIGQGRPGWGRPDLRWIAAAAMPLMCIGWLFVAWGGLVPAQWRAVNEQFSAASAAYLFSMVGWFGIFYCDIRCGCRAGPWS